ncbi:MAG TPA: radical SAM family heme chaperone HemW [Candidatus Hydrogenedentes bacterium]|nr:radical SAM family heme chaperone HemW [Candidatus Hydrogenedentota bacterium]HOJ68385.1 radical SAM family heme chaperone HemW [Candidatus Hydrogenedentota bacterium]HOK89510.1 radical SAM family heme chaperone HemW [Candidatus Hydrogenedentota bacterium]
MIPSMGIASVYIHVPFCRTRCHYCDFVTRAIPGMIPDTYVDGLRREIDRKTENLEPIATLFLGGGTPSLLSPDQLERVLDRLDHRVGLPRDAEISLEANPDDITAPLVQSWRALGVNRVSLGIQSLDDRVLQYLGRRHDARKARQAMELVANTFDNWSVDLMFGALPRNTLEATLDEIIRVAPPHLSVYGLTWEPGTPLYARLDEAPDDETWLELYDTAESMLVAGGWEHYEISNYARPGRRCQHNLVYWRNERYEGLGPAAWRFDGIRRERNPNGFRKWLARPGEPDASEVLSDFDIRVETVIQHARLADGIDRNTYLERFGGDLETDFGSALRRCVDEGLMEPLPGDTGWRPTPRGFRLNNRIGLLLLECRPTPAETDTSHAHGVAEAR